MQNQDSSRENLGSRLGFILLTAGCAIGLGNIWRFPFICGQYGGAIFVLIYLFFLIALGFPVMVMELSLGRASRRNIFGAYKTLAQDQRLKWHYPGAVFFLGNVVLMIFYTTVTGWMVAYALKFATGAVSGLGAEGVGRHFGDFLANPVAMVGCMLFAVVFATAICAIGLRKGVERITKLLMGCLFLLLVGLCIRALFLPGAAEGMRFYLWPNPASIEHVGILKVIVEAMNQAFFTLSLGVGSIAIFGSYIDRDHTLPKETLAIVGLDTLVALLAGVIIFPACFSFGVSPDSGPGLVFVSLPNVFNVMHGGRFWGTLFFLFMSAAALTTVVAVFENIIAFLIDELRLGARPLRWRRARGSHCFHCPARSASICFRTFTRWGEKARFSISRIISSAAICCRSGAFSSSSSAPRPAAGGGRISWPKPIPAAGCAFRPRCGSTSPS